MTRKPDAVRRERESRALQLVEGVLDLAPAERQRALEQRAGDDAALRNAALELLQDCEVAEREVGVFATSAGVFAAPMIEALATSEREASTETLAILRRALSSRYEVIRELGRGGSATVFLAHDRKHQSQVAIKVIRGGPEDTAQRSRFHQEIVLSAQLRHPYVVPLLDSGSVDGVPYYVMPYVAGESLRQRIDAKGALALDEVLVVTRDVAEALDFAHKAGIVHRDIKPQNILLSDGHAFVVDFGIALALERSIASRLTDSGLVVGTPLYMAPEQAASESEVGPRADVYSLGCVVYEMLTGEPPFGGTSARAVIAKHAAAPPPLVSVVRPWGNSALDAAVRRALAKVPADRYATAGDFHQALVTAAGPQAETTTRRRWVGVAAGVAAIVALATMVRPAIWSSAPSPIATDTSVVAVFPLIGSVADSAATRALSAAVHDAVARWTGIRVVDPSHMATFDMPATSRLWNVGPASVFAAQQEAGRFVWGDMSREGDSVRIHLRLSTVAAGGAVVADRVLHLPGYAAAAPVIGRSVDALLIRAPVPRWSATWEASRSLPAQQAFARAGTHFAAWQLDSARATLEEATRHDRSFGEAHLWLALSRVWSNEPPARYSVAATQAMLHAASMSPRVREYARAVLLESREELGEACQAWRRLAVADSTDFVGWYGAARCHRRDAVVVRDPRSPSGWRFRSSFRQAVEEFQAAFRLHPTILHSFAEASFEPLRTMLLAGSSVYVDGRRDDDTTRFFARMTMHDDTIAFIPYAGERSLLAPMGAERSRAVMTQRRILRDIMATWVSDERESADARAGLAIALALTGDAGALDTIRVARSLARTSAESLHIALTDTWLRVAAGVSHQDVEMLAKARALGDSLLQHATAQRSSDRRQMVALAALFGRPHVAAALASTAEFGRRMGVPSFALTDALAYLTYAAMGGPADSLAERRRRIALQLQREPDAGAREAGVDLLLRGATLCFPACSVAPYRENRRADYLLDVQLDFADSAFASVREKLVRLASTTRPMDLPQDLTFDTIVPEADLFLRLGDPAAAIGRIEPTMTRLFLASPSRLADPIEAASLARALRLRAEAARQLGDQSEAARWQQVVTVLTGGRAP